MSSGSKGLYNYAQNFSENRSVSGEFFPHRITLNDCIMCNNCSAIKLLTERLRICCSNRKVKLREPEIPVLLQQLLCSQDHESKNFRNKIRIYNSIFSFASVGVKLDWELANAKSRIYTFRV